MATETTPKGGDVLKNIVGNHDRSEKLGVMKELT